MKSSLKKAFIRYIALADAENGDSELTSLNEQLQRLREQKRQMNERLTQQIDSLEDRKEQRRLALGQQPKNTVNS